MRLPPPHPVVLWSGFGDLIERLPSYRVYKRVLCGLKKVCSRFINSKASV